MDDSKETLNKHAIRLRTVKSIDPFVTNIIDTASRTALYNYDIDKDGWTKTEVEGTFMVYCRDVPPHNMITIINRLNKTNFVEPLTANCDYQVKPPYLLFRTNTGIIYGIWFSEKDDVHRISKSIADRMNEEQQPSSASSDTNILNDPAIAAARTSSGDIMSMLSKAHGKYTNKGQELFSIGGSSSNNNDLVKPSPMKKSANEAMDNSSNAVADFFAKVGGGMAAMTPITTNLSSPSSSNVPIVAKSTTNPVLQQLFQGAVAVGGQASVAGSIDSANTGSSAPINVPNVATQNPVSSVPTANVPGTTPLGLSVQELEGRFKENLHFSGTNKEENLYLTQNNHINTPYHINVKSDQSLSLLSPQVFTASQLTDNPLPLGESPSSRNFSGLFTTSSANILDMKPLNVSEDSLNGNHLPNIISSNSLTNITPLTQEQLAQAFNVLLKKDDFIHQLHEAYIQALHQSIKGCL